jgi:hypothetical protein
MPIFPIAMPSAVPTPVQIAMLTAKPSGILGTSRFLSSRDQFLDAAPAVNHACRPRWA